MVVRCGCGLEESNARNPAIQPGTGYTTKPGVAVTTAHPRKAPTKTHEPQRGSTSQMQVLRASIGRCGTPLGFGDISVSLPGVRRNAATPGFAVKPRWG